MSYRFLRYSSVALLLSLTQVAEAQMTVSSPAPTMKTRATIEVSSASIQRGYTLTEGPVLQPSLWIFSNSGWGAGIWGSMSLLDQSGTNPVFYEQKRGEFQKIDLFLYYKIPLPELVRLELLYAQYIYPEDNLLPDATVRDTIVKFTVPGLLNPFVSAAYGLNDPIKRDLYMEAGIQQQIFQEGAHAVTAAAMTTYRNPGEETPRKKEGMGHSMVSIGYGYQGLKLSGQYIIEGEKAVLNTTTATEFSTSAGYTAWF